MSGVATAVVGGSLVSAYLGNEAADNATDASQDATAAELALQREMYNRTQRQNRTWRRAGKRGIKNLLSDDGIGSFEFDMEADPGYQFAIEEALRGTSRQHAAQGGNNSGNVLAALNDRAVGMASQHANDIFNRQFMPYQDTLNRYADLAGLGGSSVANTGAAGTNMANAMGNAYMNNAANQANAGYYQAGSMNNAIQGGINNYLTYDYLNQPATTNYYGGYTGQYGGR